MTYPIPVRNRRGLIDFAVGDPLGEGSLSTVHVAEEKGTKRKYAIKMFDRNHLRSNRKDADVTMEEHCLRRANHPGIAKLHAEFRDEARWYLVLEYCPGGELWSLVKDVGCSETVGRHYLAQVVEALSYLRDAGIVHRDVKGENVLIGAEGNCKLVDFGSAKDLCNPHIKGAGTRSFKTVQEENVGTPNFMAPEAVKNKCSDFRSDMWSFGCMVYQIITGIAPFGVNLLRLYDKSMKAQLRMPPGLGERPRDLIRRTVVLDPNSRLGASDMREIRNHAFFKEGLECLGSRMEGAHARRAPVPSLEETCLRALGRRWEALEERAVSHPALKEGSSLRAEARAFIARFQDSAARARRRLERRENGASSGSDSGEEGAARRQV